MISSLRLLGRTPFKKTSMFFVESFFDFIAYENSLKEMINLNSNAERLIHRIRAKLSELFHFNKYWLMVLHSIIMTNVIILCMDRYPISKEEKEILDNIDFAIFFFYLIEITLKIISYGSMIFFKSPLNLLDIIIISLNLFFEIYCKYHDFPGIISIRNLKVLRIFRTIFYSKVYKSFSVLIKGMIFALTKLRYFIFIIGILVINVSLIGKEIFAYRIRFQEIDELVTATNL